VFRTREDGYITARRCVCRRRENVLFSTLSVQEEELVFKKSAFYHPSVTSAGSSRATGERFPAFGQVAAE